jgi:hypothetical protein
VLGEVTVSKNGVVYGTATLVAGANVELSRLQYMKAQLYGTFHKPIVAVVLWLLVILLAVYILSFADIVFGIAANRPKHWKARWRERENRRAPGSPGRRQEAGAEAGL